MAVSTARTLECARCAAAFSVQAVSAEVQCPFCGHRQALGAHAELDAYRADVHRRVAAADEQHQVAAALESWNASRASDPRRNLAMVYGFMLGAPFALAMLWLVVDAVGLLPKQRGPELALGLGATSYLGLAGYFVWYFTGRVRRRARKTALAPVKVACPTCGAPGALTPGDAVDTCSYCNAALIPSRTAIHHGVDAARAAVREAALQRHRAQRVAVAKATNLGGWNIFMPVMIVGSFLLMIGGSAIGFSIEMLRGNEPFHPAIFLLWALTLAMVGGVAVYTSRRRERKHTLRAALEHATRQLGGQLLPTAHDRVGWLNTYWSGDYEPRFLTQTYVAGSASVEVGGFRALVDVDLHSQRPPPRLDLLLAAWVPGQTEGHKPHTRVKHPALAGLGFLVYRTPGGLVARAQPPLLQACLADPSAVHVAVTALAQLAELARTQGCDPVDG